MKVVIFKTYEARDTVYYNYGDDSSEVWHNLNAIEGVKEISREEFEVLKKAVAYFNSSNVKKNYILKFAEVVDDSEYDDFILDFKNYEKTSLEKAEKLRLKYEAEAHARKEKEEAKKHERIIKRYMKDLSLTREEVVDMLNKKK